MGCCSSSDNSDSDDEKRSITRSGERKEDGGSVNTMGAHHAYLIFEFCRRVGKLTSEEIRPWANSHVSEKYYAETHMIRYETTYRRTREEYIQLYDKAIEKGYNMKNVEIVKVEYMGEGAAEVITWRAANCFKNGQVAYFDIASVFRDSDGLLLSSIWHQYVPKHPPSRFISPPQVVPPSEHQLL